MKNNDSLENTLDRNSSDYKQKKQQYLDNPDLIRSVMAHGCEKARKVAKDTMRDIREVMGINF
jgi:hypothetical protein